MDKKMACCENCQIYWTCDTKWYRGEKREENTCCSRCNLYDECLAKFQTPQTPKKSQ